MKDSNCIFCKIISGEFSSYTLYEDEDFKVIFDISPVTKGHAILIAKKHYKNLFELDDQVASRALVVVKKVATALASELNCDGFNLLQNNEAIAGQTIFHFHIHLIPRYKDDNVSLVPTPGQLDTEFATELADKIKTKLS
ncbi:MAG: HIT family protein [Lachnospiraceae bacterium]|nr:HIT family protein [Lachnospiraceae bacterium]MEE0863323.1 HIT family protein [Lachnospiraceae bacterium]